MSLERGAEWSTRPNHGQDRCQVELKSWKVHEDGDALAKNVSFFSKNNAWPLQSEQHDPHLDKRVNLQKIYQT